MVHGGRLGRRIRPRAGELVRGRSGRANPGQREKTRWAHVFYLLPSLKLAKGTRGEARAVKKRQNPARARALMVYTARHPRVLIRTARLGRDAARTAAAVRRPKVRNEAQTAAVSIGQAVARARKIGLASAMTDDTFADLVARALVHASNSAAELRRREPKHRARGVALAAFGLIVVVVGLLFAWMRKRGAGELRGATASSAGGQGEAADQDSRA